MYRVSELAEKCNVNKETIRYYERVGYLKSIIERMLVIGCIQKKASIV
jgi:predicted site-specific integrase-resolvase